MLSFPVAGIGAYSGVATGRYRPLTEILGCPSGRRPQDGQSHRRLRHALPTDPGDGTGKRIRHLPRTDRA